MPPDPYPGDSAMIAAVAAARGVRVEPDEVLALRPFRELAALTANLRGGGAGFDPDLLMAEAGHLQDVLTVAALAARQILDGLDVTGPPAGGAGAGHD